MWAEVEIVGWSVCIVSETSAMLDGARDERRKEDPEAEETFSCAAKCWRGTLQSVRSINLYQAFPVMKVYLSS